MPIYPAMKPKQLLAILKGLGYETQRQVGSHRRLVCEGRPPLTFAFHSGATIPPGLVRKILVQDVGLTHVEAAATLGLKE